MWRRVLVVLGGILLLGTGLLAALELWRTLTTPAAPQAPATTPPTPPVVHALAPPAPPPGPDYAELSATLAQVLAAHPGPGIRAIAVVDGDGRPVLLDRADTPMIPASTQKVVTAAAALTALGPDFRYRTEIAATVSPGADGTLAGDLVLVGSGDPALSTPLFSTQVAMERPRTPLEALADQVAAAGVRRVTGRVLGDSTALADEPVPAGWIDRYFRTLDGARMSGLTVDAGRQLFFEGPALRGRPSPDPAADAAAALAGLLTERRIAVDGGAAPTRSPPPVVVSLGFVDSPPLRDLLRWTLQRSDNPMADAIFRTLGTLAGGDGTWTASTFATRRALGDLGLRWEGVIIADGSGLSLANRLPASFLVELDASMGRGAYREQWDALMAVAGESGTLRARLIGTPAEHRLHGKTGSLSGVRSLVGSVTGPGGSRLHLAVIGNDLDGAGVQVTRALQDALAIALTQELDRCATVPCAA